MAEQSAIMKPISRDEALYLLRQTWPDAPDGPMLRASIICAQYNLNPLMRHVALIRFGTKGGVRWEPVLEIKATRIIAQRKHKYSYIDGPRVLTRDEQESLFGFVDEARIWAVTVLEEDGRRYPGYGSWMKSERAYGEEKGNSQLNMAFIRSERNAIDKMAPGEIPVEFDVADGAYMPPVSIKEAVEEGKAEFIETTEKQVEEIWGKKEAPPATLEDLEIYAWQRWSKRPVEIYKELGVEKRADCDLSPWEAFVTLKEIFEGR